MLNFTIYLAMLFALVLSALSLPGDIRDRTLHTVVTKPVRKIEIVLGRVAGFVFVGTVLLVLIGAISYVFTVRGLTHTHKLTRADTPCRDAARWPRHTAAGHDDPLARARARGDDHRAARRGAGGHRRRGAGPHP